jgi:hypothetical protein
MQKRNKTKTVIRIQDLKPKKDAKGGVMPSGPGAHGPGSHGPVGHGPKPHGPHGH